MAWKVELSEEADRQFDKLDPQIRPRILKFLYERIAKLDDPRSIGEALHGSKLGEFWKYRVGDYRLISSIQDKQVVILVLRVGHRSQVYERSEPTEHRRAFHPTGKLAQTQHCGHQEQSVSSSMLFSHR